MAENNQNSSGNSGDNSKNPGDEVIQVPQKLLVEMQEKMADLERRDANREAEIAGLREVAESKGAETTGNALREKKSFEPKFRTVRIRKYPIAGDIENLGYVIGWSSRGAYQEVDRSGVSPQTVDYLDIFFLGRERNADGKLQAEKVRLLDLLNKGEQIHCKILKTDAAPRLVPTGEEIDVTVFDPQHGLMATGDKVDGYVTFSDIKYTVQIPGIASPVEVDGAFVN